MFELVTAAAGALCALWIGYACIRRMWLMQLCRGQALHVLAYITILVWAVTSLLDPPQARSLEGLIGVATLFWAGRNRWLQRAPADLTRVSRSVVMTPQTYADVRGGLRTSVVLPDPYRDRITQVLQEMEQR